MGLIDDKGLLGDTPQECARQLDRVRALVRMCGQRCNVGKFWGLHLETRGKGIATVRPGLRWGTEGIPEAKNDTHVRFLGGNANPVGGGGAVKILKEVKSGIKRVKPKLHYWPVSQAVGQMILEGVVVNKMIYRVVINVPTEQMCDDMVGAITRAYRDVFGMARPTPREVVYTVLGVEPPDKRPWVTVVVKLLKARNSGNYLLRDILRGHMQAIPQVDRDVSRVKEHLKGMGLTLRTLTRDVYYSEPENGGVLTVRGGGCELWDDLGGGGGAVMVVDPTGRVLLWEVVTFTTLTLVRRSVVQGKLGEKSGGFAR